jgi:hypothetical protein
MGVSIAEAQAKARELGAKQVGWTTNWCWARDFPTPEAGREPVRWCDANGVECRGYYPASPGSSNENLRVDGVRFRAQR